MEPAEPREARDHSPVLQGLALIGVLAAVMWIVEAVDRAARDHGEYRAAQEEGLRETFDDRGGRPSERAAEAIAAFLLTRNQGGRTGG